MKVTIELRKLSCNRFGSMVAFFRYSPIDILSVHLPPSVLEFNGHVQPEWIRKEATQVQDSINFHIALLRHFHKIVNVNLNWVVTNFMAILI